MYSQHSKRTSMVQDAREMTKGQFQHNKRYIQRFFWVIVYFSTAAFT